MPAAEANPKLAEYVLRVTSRKAGQHDMHSLFVRIKVLEQLGHTKSHLKEVWAYSQELGYYDHQQKMGNKFKQSSKDKIPQAVKAKIFPAPTPELTTNPYELAAAKAWVAIDKRMKAVTK